jgi:hypothetical protein
LRSRRPRPPLRDGPTYKKGRRRDGPEKDNTGGRGNALVPRPPLKNRSKAAGP